MNLQTRHIKLFKVSQPTIDCTGLLGQHATRGIFVKDDETILAFNGRMFIEGHISDHGLSKGQYYIQGLSLKESKNKGFFPVDVETMETEYDVVATKVGVPYPGKFAWFCYQSGVVADLGDCSKILDVLAHEYQDAAFYFKAKILSKDHPIIISVRGPNYAFTIRVLPYPYTDLGIEKLITK